MSSERSGGKQVPLEAPDSPTFGDFEELDSEIQRMSLHADAILNSIRTAGDESVGKVNQHHDSSSENHGVLPTLRQGVEPSESMDGDDDLSLVEEMGRLNEVTASLRKSLTEECDQPTATIEQPDSPKFQKPDGDSSGIGCLLISNLVVWAVVIFLIVHAQKNVLDADGYLQVPLLGAIFR